MEPSVLERIKDYQKNIVELQDTCTHQFILTKPTRWNRFDINENFDAECTLCMKQITFSPWDRCPKCFNNLSEVEVSTVPGKFQGSGHGNAYDYPTLEKQCGCGVTVWKYK